jgi:U3 small nucleolar RNA-associated protein 4
MDIHRIRYVPYNPAPINCVAFSQSVATKRGVPIRLAIGRASGDIEIWNPLSGAWHQETIIHGGKDRAVGKSTSSHQHPGPLTETRWVGLGNRA